MSEPSSVSRSPLAAFRRPIADVEGRSRIPIRTTASIDVFPEDFYRSLLRHLPGITAYQNLFEITTLKLDHFRFRDQRDLADGWTASLPDELRRLLGRFQRLVPGPELAEAVLDSFAGPMRARFGETGRVARRSRWRRS